MIDAIKVVIFASKIVTTDLLNPKSNAWILFPKFLFNSSFILSNINTFASTAIPTVKIIPAIPGRVSVASKRVRKPINIKRLDINEILATRPKKRYLTIIKAITKIKPISKDRTPASIESCPKSGPTVLSSTTDKGAGRAPERKSKARSVAVWKVKFPEIVPWPPVIESLITGALIASLSKIIAILLPIFLLVACPNLWAPSLLRVNATIGSWLMLSYLGFASIKLSPVKIILLLTDIFSCVSVKVKISLPNSVLLSVTNLKDNWAVFPKSSFILSGSFTPGNSTKILLLPRFIIEGSFVPVSSILFLTISIDWSTADVFKLIIPFFDKPIMIWLLTKLYSNSKDLYLSKKVFISLFLSVKKLSNFSLSFWDILKLILLFLSKICIGDFFSISFF